MKIIVVKSHELNDKDWTQITSGFNESFLLDKNPIDLFQYYTSNEIGYSFHAVCRTDSGEIIAHSSIFPYYYFVQKERMLFGLSGGTFVLKKYRKEAFLYVDLLDELKHVVKSNGVKLTYGISNENSFNLAVRMLGSTYVKDLKYYAVPVALTDVILKKKFIFVSKFFRIFLLFWFFVVKLYSRIIDSVDFEKSIHLDLNDEVLKNRFGKNYKHIITKEISGVYRIVNERGIRTAYLLDFRRKGQRSTFALSSLMNHILKFEEVDLFIYIGELTLIQPILLKVPRRFEPQRLPLTFDLLENQNLKLKEVISKPENWDFSLLNFDVR